MTLSERMKEKREREISNATLGGSACWRSQKWHVKLILTSAFLKRGRTPFLRHQLKATENRSRAKYTAADPPPSPPLSGTEVECRIAAL